MNPVVTGIGGAFIDLTYYVADATLERLCIPKGGISFVDSATQQRFISENSSELQKVTPGGSAANSVYAAQLLGAPSAFAGKFGNDEFGSTFTRSLTDIGVRLATEPATGITNTVLVFVTPDGEKSFVVCPDLAATLQLGDMDLSIIKESNWLLLEAQLFQYGEASRAAALSAVTFGRNAGVKIALNLGSVSVVEKSVELIHELLGDRQIDLLIGNHEEFSTLFRGAPTDTIFESLSRHVDLAVYTRGERGALALHKSQIIQTSTTASVPVVDTSGAGDSFLGALLAGISRGNELQAALNCAHKVASLVVQQTGARLPNLPSDINELFERET